jgi:hypothetical protein
MNFSVYHFPPYVVRMKKKLFEEVKNERSSIEKELENEKRSRMGEREEKESHANTYTYTGTVSILFCCLLARRHYNYIADVIIFSLIMIVCVCVHIVSRSSQYLCFLDQY